MDDDLRTLFKLESEKLTVGPPPRRTVMTSNRRRTAARRTLAAAAVFAVVATTGAFLVAGGPDSNSSNGVDPATEIPNSRGGRATGLAGSEQVAVPPAQMPACEGDTLSVRFVDWPVEPSSTSRRAVEQLLGIPLPDAGLDEVSATRTDVIVPAIDGQVRAVVTVVLDAEGDWNPTRVYSCTADRLHLAK